MCDLDIISSNLEWCQHVCSIVSKALICSHQILHCFSTNNAWILLNAYIRVPTVVENHGKKLSWKVMKNLFKTESHEIVLRAEKKFF